MSSVSQISSPFRPIQFFWQIDNSETLKGFPAAAEQSCCPPSVSVHFQVKTPKEYKESHFLRLLNSSKQNWVLMMFKEDVHYLKSWDVCPMLLLLRSRRSLFIGKDFANSVASLEENKAREYKGSSNVKIDLMSNFAPFFFAQADKIWPMQFGTNLPVLMLIWYVSFPET